MTVAAALRLEEVPLLRSAAVYSTLGVAGCTIHVWAFSAWRRRPGPPPPPAVDARGDNTMRSFLPLKLKQQQ